MNEYILSVLVPTTPERVLMFARLYQTVMDQVAYCDTVHPSLGMVEVLFDDSKRFLDGGLSIGKKRESLVKRAKGKYCCFLDSDESISPNYIETLLRLCWQNKDICTFRAIAKLDNYWAVYDMTLTYEVNQESGPEGTIARTPWHTCPVRTEFAKRYEFEDINYSEDAIWMKLVLRDCKSEAHSSYILLQYNHSSKHSEADIINKNEELQPIK